MTIYKPTSVPADREPIVRAVHDDVRAGLAPYLQAESFDLDGPFAAAGALVEGTTAVVQWVFVGIDNGKGFNNLWPTGQAHHRAGRDIRRHVRGAVAFHRHIDWNGVSSQLGGSLGRCRHPAAGHGERGRASRAGTTTSRGSTDHRSTRRPDAVRDGRIRVWRRRPIVGPIRLQDRSGRWGSGDVSGRPTRSSRTPAALAGVGLLGEDDVGACWPGRLDRRGTTSTT